MSEDRTAILTFQDVSVLPEIANLACQKGLPSAARTIVDGVLAEKPGFVPALITLAYSHVVVDEFDVALEMLEGILTEHPDDDDARCMEILALMLAGRNDDAKKSMEGFSQDCPQKQLAWALIENI